MNKPYQRNTKRFIKDLIENFPVESDIKLHNYFFQKELVHFAYSRIKVKGSTFFATRILLRNGFNPWESTSVMFGERRKKGRTEPEVQRGEDPRLFSFQGQPWVQYQIYNPIKSDVEIYIQNIQSKQRYQLISPLGFNGKNWIAFVKDEELHFVYSLEPFVVFKAEFLNYQEIKLSKLFSPINFTPRWETDFENSIGRIRGGSPAVLVGNSFIGFTHQVYEGHNYAFHTLGCFSMTLSGQTIKFVPLSRFKSGFLIDPYGLSLKKSKMVIDCSVVEGDLHLPSSNICNLRLTLNTAELLRFIESY